MRFLTFTSALLLATSAPAQWQLQDSHSTASLRGIHNVGNGIAWASGTGSTVLRTLDMGKTWQPCSTPPDAEKLDFRGVQAFDASTAIVMSSGPGDLSRLYKTTDGCKTWKLIFANPYGEEGFFDALFFIDRDHGILFGDPTSHTSPQKTPTEYDGAFRIRVTADGGKIWGPISEPDFPATPGNGLHALHGEAAFAASNSSIFSLDGLFWFVTSASRVASRKLFATGDSRQFLFQSLVCSGAIDPLSQECGQPWVDFANASVPLDHTTPAAGIFSIFFRNRMTGVVVGGNYEKPDDAHSSAAYTLDGGATWVSVLAGPHGYRSAVAYDPSTKTWITVGTNGTDISTDDGRNWRALRPGPLDNSDADKNWNALSLPFVAGAHGRIGILRSAAISAPANSK